jgi:hypothetical protein
MHRLLRHLTHQLKAAKTTFIVQQTLGESRTENATTPLLIANVNMGMKRVVTNVSKSARMTSIAQNIHSASMEEIATIALQIANASMATRNTATSASKSTIKNQLLSCYYVKL